MRVVLIAAMVVIAVRTDDQLSSCEMACTFIGRYLSLAVVPLDVTDGNCRVRIASRDPAAYGDRSGSPFQLSLFDALRDLLLLGFLARLR